MKRMGWILEVASVLLNASQQVRAEAPFLLVLADTPGLLTHLGRTDATFWDRLGQGLLHARGKPLALPR